MSGPGRRPVAAGVVLQRCGAATVTVAGSALHSNGIQLRSSSQCPDADSVSFGHHINHTITLLRLPTNGMCRSEKHGMCPVSLMH
jgi:hypothetical protein